MSGYHMFNKKQLNRTKTRRKMKPTSAITQLMKTICRKFRLQLHSRNHIIQRHTHITRCILTVSSQDISSTPVSNMVSNIKFTRSWKIVYSWLVSHVVDTTNTKQACLNIHWAHSHMLGKCVHVCHYKLKHSQCVCIHVCVCVCLCVCVCVCKIKLNSMIRKKLFLNMTEYLSKKSGKYVLSLIQFKMKTKSPYTIQYDNTV